MKSFFLTLLLTMQFAIADMLIDPETCHETYENQLDRFFNKKCKLTYDYQLIGKECFPNHYNKGGIKVFKCNQGPNKGCCYEKNSGSTTSDFTLTKDCSRALK